jgi:DNA-binding winged helix-turn-helix (wHTH) protein/tetratricopeptide (TPR) repeat protein
VASSHRIFCFDVYEVDESLVEIRCQGSPVPLEPKPLQMLIYLLRHRVRVVPKQELVDEVWGVAISDSAISTALKEIRRALNDDGVHQRWVRTLPRRGYRFVGAVTEQPRPADSPGNLQSRAREDELHCPWSQRWEWRTTLPFVGREEELARVEQGWHWVQRGRLGFVLIRGEAGIGKTRLMESFLEQFPEPRVLRGACFEGESVPPYYLLAQLLLQAMSDGENHQVLAALSPYADVLVGLLPQLRDWLPSVSREERGNVLDQRLRLWMAVRSALEVLSSSGPLLLMIDDLQWCDADSLGLIRLLIPGAKRLPILILAACRNEAIDVGTPIGSFLGGFPKDLLMDQIELHGLDSRAIHAIVAAAAPRIGLAGLSRIQELSRGNPFFVRELITSVQGADADAQRASTEHVRAHGDQIFPFGIRYVLEQRIAQLPAETLDLLRACACFSGSISLAAALRASDLQDSDRASILNDALFSQILTSTRESEHYQFTHALLREFIYGQMNPDRRSRLHRSIAIVLEKSDNAPDANQMAELIHQYRRSGSLPGAEQGVQHCIAAAKHAQRTGAHFEAAEYWRAALELSPIDGEARDRAVLLSRLAVALVWSFQISAAIQVATKAGELLAAIGDRVSVADHFARVADAVWLAAYDRGAWRLAELGLKHIDGRRDLTWARLTAHRLAREQAEVHGSIGISLPSADRRELSTFLRNSPPPPRLLEQELYRFFEFESRADVLQAPDGFAVFRIYMAGDYRYGVDVLRRETAFSLERGRITSAIHCLAETSLLESALGQLGRAEESLSRAQQFVAAIPSASSLIFAVLPATSHLALVRGAGLEALMPAAETLLHDIGRENEWRRAVVWSGVASLYATLGRYEDARRLVAEIIPAITLGSGSDVNYTLLIHYACEVLWKIGAHHSFPLEKNLRDKTLVPDFRYPHADARLSLARLCALEDRQDEAVHWFNVARQVLEDQGAAPLRAVTDYDEALMYARCGRAEDRRRALGVLEAAVAQFSKIGMTGWLQRADQLRLQIR